MTKSIYYKSPVGLLKIQGSGNAICEVSFVKTIDNSLVNEDEATCESNSLIIKECTRQLNEYFAGTRILFDLVLSQSGTVFQQMVWGELQKIKYGKTVSYLSLSKSIGNTKAIRAVGMANGRNNIAIIVPCHRVIGSNGSLVGYAGDLWRKKWLLNHEARFANGVQKLFD